MVVSKERILRSNKKIMLKYKFSNLSGDSTGRLITLSRGTKRPTRWTLKKYLGGAMDFLGRPTNIVNLSIVLWSPNRHRQIS